MLDASVDCYAPGRMAQRRASSFDDKRARIAALASAPAAAAIAGLRPFLAEKNAYLVGEAAAVAQQLEARELLPEMAAALERLLRAGAAADKGCLGKRRVLEALLALSADVEPVYLAALRYTQREPAFPHAVDTAAPIRGLAAHALVEIDYPAAVAEICPLLVDPEPMARAEAARALSRSGLEAAGPVLHLKALVGDPDPDVVEACFSGILRLDARRYLPVVTEALNGEQDAGAEAAALALGSSRCGEALGLLRAALLGESAPRREQSLIMAIGLLRSDDACSCLLDLVEHGREPAAAAAIAALAIHQQDRLIGERVRALAEARGSGRLAEVVAARFG
jgi:HEAT repeat protein